MQQRSQPNEQASPPHHQPPAPRVVVRLLIPAPAPQRPRIASSHQPTRHQHDSNRQPPAPQRDRVGRGYDPEGLDRAQATNDRGAILSTGRTRIWGWLVNLHQIQRDSNAPPAPNDSEKFNGVQSVQHGETMSA